MTLVINTKNKKEEQVLKAFLQSLKIGFYSETDEDAALFAAMEKGKKTGLLNNKEKENFIASLKKAK